VLWLRRYERMTIENWHFRSNRISWAQNFRYKGSSPSNHSFCQKTRMNDLSCGIRMWAELSIVLSQSAHLTDEQTDRWTAFSWLDSVACKVCSTVNIWRQCTLLFSEAFPHIFMSLISCGHSDVTYILCMCMFQ